MPSKKRKGTPEPPISLSPLDPRDALVDLMKVKPKRKKKATQKKDRK